MLVKIDSSLPRVKFKPVESKTFVLSSVDSFSLQIDSRSNVRFYNDSSRQP